MIMILNNITQINNNKLFGEPVMYTKEASHISDDKRSEFISILDKMLGI